MDLSTQSVCAIVVNWNGWRDTVVCIESLLALTESPLRILVCDNGSTDGSVSELRCWLRSRPAHDQATVDLLPLPTNLGYAGALNAGIKWAQSHARTQLFWLLNNDVQALPGALRELIAARHSVPSAGLCGSVLLEWDDPTQVQAIGGRYRKWLGVGWHDKREPVGGDAVCVDMDYPVGASLLVDEIYVARVGLMDENYFLYCEEMDWAERGRRRGFRPVIALRSRLRHKEGASTGSRGGVRHKSMLSEYYGVTNRLRITRRFWPWYVPVVWLSLLLVIADRLVHREYRRAALVLRLMFSPHKWLH